MLEAEQQARRESEAKIFRTFEEKTGQLREEIAREGRTRVEAEAALRRYVDIDIPKLYEQLREEAQSRERGDDFGASLRGGLTQRTRRECKWTTAHKACTWISRTRSCPSQDRKRVECPCRSSARSALGTTTWLTSLRRKACTPPNPAPSGLGTFRRPTPWITNR